MSWREEPVVFRHGDDELVGIVALPARPAERGVLIVVGGPQYRAGSHRQFTLLARALAAKGFASLRFDYRGMGDSSGAARTFETAGEDVRVAIDRLMKHVPALREVVIWGLCDAASAALFYAHTDQRVGGLALANPWVRTEYGMARAQLKHYYLARLFQKSFWHKLAHGEVGIRAALGGVGGAVKQAAQSSENTSLPQRMENGLARFRGPVLLILSGNDLMAQEFKEVSRSPGWQKLLQASRVTRRELSEANHTFGRRDWRDRVASWTVEWLTQPPP